MKETRFFAIAMVAFFCAAVFEVIYFNDPLASLFLASLAFISMLCYTMLNVIYKWIHEGK